MKKTIVFVSLLGLLTACDFVRVIASRPTSDQIAGKKALIAAADSVKKARRDSAEAERTRVADSLSLDTAIRESNTVIMPSSQVPSIGSAALKYRYYVLMGTFSNVENADKMEKLCSDAGYEVTRIQCRHNLVAIGIGGSDDLRDAFAALTSVRKEKFCPADAWVLVNE